MFNNLQQHHRSANHITQILNFTAIFWISVHFYIKRKTTIDPETPQSIPWKNGLIRTYFVWQKVIFYWWLLNSSTKSSTSFHGCAQDDILDWRWLGWLEKQIQLQMSSNKSFAIPVFLTLGDWSIWEPLFYTKDITSLQTHIMYPILGHQITLVTHPLLYFSSSFYVVGNLSKLLYLSGDLA